MSSPDRSSAAQRRAYFLVQTVAQRLRTTADRLFMQKAEITTAQAAVLMLIAAQPGCSQSLVAQTLGQRESAVTAMIGRLKTAGLIERRPSPDDGRAWELWPTETGRQTLNRLRVPMATINELIGRAIGVQHMDEFISALKRLETILDET